MFCKFSNHMNPCTDSPTNRWTHGEGEIDCQSLDISGFCSPTRSSEIAVRFLSPRQNRWNDFWRRNWVSAANKFVHKNMLRIESVFVRTVFFFLPTIQFGNRKLNGTLTIFFFFFKLIYKANTCLEDTMRDQCSWPEKSVLFKVTRDFQVKFFLFLPKLVSQQKNKYAIPLPKQKIHSLIMN